MHTKITKCKYEFKKPKPIIFRKSFMIFLYEDNHIQLLSMTIKKYPLIGIVTMYYDLTDAKSKEKLRKLLDIHRKSDE